MFLFTGDFFSAERDMFLKNDLAWQGLNIMTKMAGLNGLGLNPGEIMDVSKGILPLRQGGTLSSRQATSPLLRLKEGEDRWKSLDYPSVFSFKIWMEPIKILLSSVCCSKNTANDRRKNLAP
ncbi:hypothetical protein TNCV_1337041 [Trichonephila clavipes]|nr:hypothetical protein TNCV_1337041 [Trichonephila clavipes]